VYLLINFAFNLRHYTSNDSLISVHYAVTYLLTYLGLFTYLHYQYLLTFQDSRHRLPTICFILGSYL